MQITNGFWLAENTKETTKNQSDFSRFLKAYEYTVQLENRTSKMPVTSWISISSSTSENLNG